MRLVDLQRTENLMPLRKLARLIVFHMFDDNATSQDLHTINHQYEKWDTHLNAVDQMRKATWGVSLSDSMPLGKKGTWEDDMRFQLGILSTWLVKNEQGGWESLKKQWSDHGIDYRKTAQFGFLFQEVYTKADFDNADKILKQHMKTNPEDYK